MMKCPNCDLEITAPAKFCSECGTPLTVSSDPPEKRGTRTDTPPGPTGPARRAGVEGERRLVTVMFADISGFTGLSESMDPEDLRDLMNACFDILVPIVNKYGGTVDKFIGDEIMALFGAPLAHENDAELAVRAALEMRERLLRFNAERGASLGVHFGINTGMVITGMVGAANRQDYSVMGDSVVIAKRLEETSKSGQILVGQEVFDLTGRLFDYRTIGPVPLKGKSETVNVFEALGIQKTARAGVLRHRVGSSLVGRNREMEILKSKTQALLRGEGGVLSVIGREGTGKSRLIAELRKSVQGRDIAWLEGRSISLELSIRYLPFQEMIRTAARISEDDDEKQSRDKLVELLFSLFGAEAPQYLPFIFTLMAMGLSDEYKQRVRHLDADAVKRQIYIAVRSLIRRQAENTPLCLIFEDVHWMDAASCELLESILDLVYELPVLIFIVGRPEETSPMPRLDRKAANEYSEVYVRLTISNILPGEQEVLLANLLGCNVQETTLFKRLLHKASGNPLFMEEIIRSLIDHEALVWNESLKCWRLSPGAENFQIPNSILGVIMSRIDKLDNDLQQLIKTASVIGRSFLFRILKGLVDSEAPLEEKIAELKQSEFIREKKRQPELEYIFKHVLTQEAAYESILYQKRRDMHRLVGQCIERLFNTRLEEFYGLLAYHYSHGEDWEKAQEYLFKAADQAVGIAADYEALDLYQKAVDAYQKFRGDQWEPFEKAVLERKIGEALFRTSQYSRSLEYLARSFRYLGFNLPETRWGIRWNIFKQLLRQVLHRIFPYVFVRPTSNAPPPHIREFFRNVELIAWIDFHINHERVAMLCLLSVNKLESSVSTPGTRSSAYSGVASICNLIGLHGIARMYNELARAEVENNENPFRSAICETMRGLNEDCTGNWEKAKSHHELAGKLYLAAGDVKRWATPVSMHAEILFQQGRFEESLALCTQVSITGRESGDTQVMAYGEGLRARLLCCSGKVKEALPIMEKSVRDLLSIPDYQIAALFQNYLAECRLRMGEYAHAFELLEKNVDLIRSKNLRGPYIPICFNKLTQACLAYIDREGSTEVTSAYLGKAEKSCAKALRLTRAFAIGKPCAFRNQATLLFLKGKRKKALKYWDKSIQTAQDLNSPYLAGLTFFEMGRRLEDEDCLAQAIRLLDRVGAVDDLKNARKAREKLLATQ